MDAHFRKPPSGRRPHSAGPVYMEPTGPRSRNSPAQGSGSSYRTDPHPREQNSSPELDFTDKLKALRELITSSKAYREVRKSGAERRVIAKRTDVPNFCEARPVDEKLKFTASSFGRRELADRAHSAQLNGNIATESNNLHDDGELSVDSDGEKYPSESSVSSLRRRDVLVSRGLELPYERKKVLEEMELDFGLSRGGAYHSEAFEDDYTRIHSSERLLAHDHEALHIPERDWNGATNKHRSRHAADNTRHLTKNGFADHKSLDLALQGPKTCDQQNHSFRKEQIDEASAQGRRSPPEHDYSSDVNKDTNIQTNVKIFMKGIQRPRSAEPSRTKAQSTKSKPETKARVDHSADVEHGTGVDHKGQASHWTQLLSQKREMSDRVSRSVPSSPVQSNVSLEFPSRASPYAYLLQEMAKQQEKELQATVQDMDEAIEKLEKRNAKKSRYTVTNHSHGLRTAVELVSDDLQQDDEVASIMDHPRPKKRIIVKRNSVRKEGGAGDSQTRSEQDNIHSDNRLSSEGLPKQSPSKHSSGRADQERSLSVSAVAREEDVMTLDRLRAALRGRRSESRASSCASSLSMTSPSPMKAVHMSQAFSEDVDQDAAPASRRTTQGIRHRLHSKTSVQNTEGQTQESAPQDSGKSVQRRVIKRPPRTSESGRSPEKSQSSFKPKSCPGNQVKIGSVYPVPEPKLASGKDPRLHGITEPSPKTERPSSAPVALLRSASETALKPVTGTKSTVDQRKELRRPRDLSPAVKQTLMLDPPQGISQPQTSHRRPRSAADFVQRDSSVSADLAAVQSLHNNVQRLHEEVSKRIGQDTYILQEYFNKTDNLEQNGHHLDTVDPPAKPEDENIETKQIRKRLSFDEEEKAQWVPRSESCVPFNVERPDQDRVESVRPRSALSVDGRDIHYGQSAADKRGFLGADDVLATSTPVLAARTSAASEQDRKTRLRTLLTTQNGNLRQNGVGVAHLRRMASMSDEEEKRSGVLTADKKWSQQYGSNSSLSAKEAADTILPHLGNASMVHLLQKLYSADDRTRQEIITKAQIFKHWQSTAHCLKKQRQIYTESLQRAQVYLNNKLRQIYFYYWRDSADENKKNRAADAIYRHHMLRKGLQAFSWAITRSKHQCNTLKQRASGIYMRAAFTKWATRAATLREERMRKAFTRWREFTREEKSIRALQTAQNMKLLEQTLEIWRQALDRRMKENMADQYLRLTVLKHSWQIWSVFTRASQEKAERQQAAENLCKRNLQRWTFHRMQLALQQSRIARQHFRMKRLKRMLHGWQQGAQISRVERQRDMATSIEHWRHTTTRLTFIKWCQQLQHRRATAMANSNLSRKTFNHWKQQWQINMERRQQIEAAITRSRLHKCLLTWRRNVVDQRRRQRQAVILLETCLMRGVLLEWRAYTAHKTGFRASLQVHVKVIERTRMLRSFTVWKDALHRRLDERRRRELWSLSCVRKATAHWRRICHLHHLEDILTATEPLRELGLMRRMFGRWLAARNKAEEENAEVVSSQHILERCALQRRFQAWRLATQRALTVKPLVQRRQRLLVTWCFDAWREYVQGRVQRTRCMQQFQKNQLSRGFARWRRHYQCQQISRAAQQNFHQRLQLCLLSEWRDILHRKQLAKDFHNHNLLRHMFYWWNDRAVRQLQEKKEQLAQEELSKRLKRQYFQAWYSGVQRQIAANEESVAHLQQRQAHNHIRSAFSSWRRSLHAHLIMRAYQKSASQRLLRSVLSEWQAATSQSLSSAVQHFVQQLGLEDTANNSFADLLALEDADQFDSPRSGSTTSLGTSVRRLFSTTDSERFADGDLDRMSLLNMGLSETLESRRQKNQRLQEITWTFVSRLSHWPVSLAFNQWYEFTVRQREFRQLSEQVKVIHSTLTVTMTFRLWRTHYINSQKATAFRNTKLMSNSLCVLREYSQLRKAKAILQEKARGHLVKHVLSKVFPRWLAKAQEQRHERSILHLWTTATPEEAELLPLELSLSRQIRQRSLRECLSVWYLRFQFLSRLKNVYHRQLLGRVVSAWQEWASERHHRRNKADAFLEARRKKLVFKTWCERLHQKRETEVRYHAAWQGYIRLIFKCWREWATVSRQRSLATHILEERSNRDCVAATFATWRRLTEKAQAVRSMQQKRLISSVFCGWRQVTQEGKQVRQVTLAFQASSLARQVGRLFHHWQKRYQQRLQIQQRRQQLAEQRALHCGRVWRKKAQKTRGRKLIVVFKYRRLAQMFSHWRSALVRVQQLKVRLQEHIAEKNKRLLQNYMVDWHQRLQSAVVTRNFTHRLLATILHAWRTEAHACRERRIRGLALQKAIQEHNLRHYFLYWRDLAIRVRSLQNNVEVKLQLRIFQAWRYTARRRCSQRRMGEKFSAMRQHRMMASAFMTLRCRFDYCQGLKDMADKLCAERERRLALQTLTQWKERFDRRLAASFYTHLLSVRTANRWHSYVTRVKMERQYEAEQLQKAVAHHNKLICSKVLDGLKREVTVRRQLQKRRLRLAYKSALSWKHLTDMAVTARSMEQEKIFAKYWHVWRLALVRQRTLNRDEMLERRQRLSQVFTAWCSICPSRIQAEQLMSGSRRSQRALASDSRSDSPTTPRSFLPVPVGGSRRTSSTDP